MIVVSGVDNLVVASGECSGTFTAQVNKEVWRMYNFVLS